VSSILDIPDEPRRVWRGPVLGGVTAAVWIAVGVVVARTFALGGWTRPALPVVCVVAIPAVLIAWAVTGAVASRAAVAALAAVVGLAVTPLATSGITPSTARLSALADHIGMPGRTVREVRIGDGRCRTACSEIRRISVVEGMSFTKAYGLTLGALKARGYDTKRYAFAPNAPARIDASRGKILVSLELRNQGQGRTRVAAVFLAKGPRPDTSVG
jgi:hypothetical protein